VGQVVSVQVMPKFPGQTGFWDQPLYGVLKVRRS
jgi:hypothetical protein